MGKEAMGTPKPIQRGFRPPLPLLQTVHQCACFCGHMPLPWRIPFAQRSSTLVPARVPVGGVEDSSAPAGLQTHSEPQGVTHPGFSTCQPSLRPSERQLLFGPQPQPSAPPALLLLFLPLPRAASPNTAHSPNACPQQSLLSARPRPSLAPAPPRSADTPWSASW